MENKNKLNEIVSHFSEFLDARLDLLMLDISEKAGSTLGNIAKWIVIAFFSFIILITISIGVSILLGNAVGNLAYGFFLTAGILILLLILAAYVSKNMIKKSLFQIIDKLTSN